MKRIKAPQLTLQKKQIIYRFFIKNPKATIGEVADKYTVTYDQARRVLKQGQAGELTRSKPRMQKKKVEDVIQAQTPDALLELQLHRCLAQLESNTEMPADERIAALKDLILVRKNLQYLSLEKHLKKTDAGIIAVIIRRFAPESSDEDIIKIYKESVEVWNISQN
jgi:hypothetical protein